MKKLLLLVSVLFSFSALKAQSAEETLEWLNVKKIDVLLGGCNSNTVSYADTLKFNADQIILSNSLGAWTRANWSNIKEVKMTGVYDLQVVFDYTYQNKPLFINLRVFDNEIRKKFEKAIKHMATLKGAKMIDSDLF